MKIRISRKALMNLKDEFDNADPIAIYHEDESGVEGDDLPEFDQRYQNGPPESLEKTWLRQGPTATAEEVYKAEQEMNKTFTKDYPMILKEEAEEEERMRAISQLRQEQENPVGQSPEAALPPSSLPQGHPPSVPPSAPQIPGAATMPLQEQGPMNPFAGYKPPQQESVKPESGLPWKPPQAGGMKPPPDFTPLPTPKALKHDCLTVHGYKKHEKWEAEQKFFREASGRTRDSA